MPTTRVYTESVVTLNNQEALQRTEELRKKAADLRAEMARLAQEKGINSKEFKTAQKELVATEKSMKSLNETTKKFEKTMNDLNGSSLNELTAAARKLQQQMRRLKPGTDEFVASSKRLKEVRTRMKEIEDQSRVTQSLFGSFFSKIGWAAVVAGALGAFKKMASDIVEQTNRIGDAWGREVAGWKASYESFTASIGSGKGWTQLVTDMSEAYVVGKKVFDLLDEIFEMNNALTMKEADLNGEIEKNRQIMMDSSYTYTEREEAARAVIAAEAELAEERKRIAQQELEANTLLLEQKTKMDEADRDFFIRGYNDNHELIEQAATYQEQLARIEGLKRQIRHIDDTADPLTGVPSRANIEMAARYQEELTKLEGQVSNTSEAVVKAYETMRRYGEGNDEIISNWVQSYVKAQDATTEMTRNTRRAQTTLNQMREQQAKAAQQAAQQAYQAEIKASEQRFKVLQNQLKEQYLAGEIAETEYQRRLTEIQEASLKDRIAIGERHKQATIDLQTQLLDLSIAQKEKLTKLMEGLEQDAVKTMTDFLSDAEKEVEQIMSEVDDLLGEQLEHELDLLAMAKEARRELRPMEAIRSDLDEELTALQEMLEKKLISEEDYHRRRAQLSAKYGAKIAETAASYLDKASTLMDTIQSAAEARLEARMQAELTAAGDNAEQRGAIEADYEQQKLDLQKRFADVNMGIEIAKATAAGALAVMQGFAELGPVGGAIAAVLVGATTAAQVALIVAQRNAIKNMTVSGAGASAPQIGNRTVTPDDGFSGGGYTGKAASDTTPVGVVHANEWVAPAAMVRAMPVTFARLESERRSGNYRSGLSGFADGGATSGDLPAGSAADLGLLQDLRQLLRQLLDSLPFPAYVVLSQLNAAKEVDAKIKKTVGK